MKHLFFEHVEDGIMTRRWHAMAYYDCQFRRKVMVLFPLHYLVRGWFWLGLKWDAYRHRAGWLTKRLADAQAKQEAWQIAEPALSFYAEAGFLPKTAQDDIRRALQNARDPR